jgi:hypothetical protein
VSQRLWWDEDQLPYYQLACDGCGASFTCYDDSCYDWALLRDAALYTGWDARSDQPDGPHHCPTCQRDQRRPRTGNQQVPPVGTVPARATVTAPAEDRCERASAP